MLNENSLLNTHFIIIDICIVIRKNLYLMFYIFNNAYDCQLICYLIFWNLAAIIENILEFRPEVAAEIAQQGLLTWLFRRIKVINIMLPPFRTHLTPSSLIFYSVKFIVFMSSELAVCNVERVNEEILPHLTYYQTFFS